MTEWLSILIQLPIVGVVVAVAWYAYQQIEKANVAHTLRERELHDKAIADLKEAHGKVATVVQDEMTLLRKEVEKLTKKVDGWIKRPPP